MHILSILMNWESWMLDSTWMIFSPSWHTDWSARNLNPEHELFLALHWTLQPRAVARPKHERNPGDNRILVLNCYFTTIKLPTELVPTTD